jgi:ATP-dependent helicase/nuclease subunit B
MKDNDIKITKIKITLALKADGPLPEPPQDIMGHITVGPIGFLSTIETQLGIPSMEVSFTTRLIQYLACIDQANQERAFYHASFEADPFSVARTLLQWRDQWYLAGWNGTFKQNVPAKLADMAAIEQHAKGNVDIGLGERIQHVIELMENNAVAVESIHLRDKRSDFPFLWQRLLEAVNAPITEEEENGPQGDPSTDLGKLQRQLLVGSTKKIQLLDDGTVVVLHADSAQDSAPLVAALTRQQVSTEPDKTLTILAEKRGELLDEALEAIGAPRMGFNALSPWRPIFQVLPMACELLWDPLNPTALFQFLSHAVGPIPARIREKLAQTVSQLPGIGSEQWEETIRNCIDKEDRDEQERLEQSIRYWLESPRFKIEVGIDSRTLTERAQRIVDWLTGARTASKDHSLYSLYTIAINQAQEFVKAVARLKAHGRDILTRDNVLRLIEDVRGSGAPVTDRQSEVIPGQPRTLRAQHAGAFYLPVDNVIWWDCQATDRVHRWPWSRTERKALADNGVVLHSEDQQLQWMGKAWLRPVLSAQKQFTLVIHSDTDRHHPIWDLVASLSEGLPILAASDLETTERLGVPQSALEVRNLPAKARWWQLPKSIHIPKRKAESFSSLDSYIHSPYIWLLNYVAKIRPGSLATVSDGNLLKGNLAHRLFEKFLNNHMDISAIQLDRIPQWADKHLIDLLQKEGAILLEPGRQAECEHFISVVQRALSTLVVHLQNAKVVKVEMELWQEGHYVGGKLNGSIDILATRADGSEAVVDIKWGGKNYRRTSLIEGSYLQLATYAKLRLAEGAGSYPMLSYFIVVDAHMFSLNHDFFPAVEIIVPDNQENTAQFWQRFEQSWRWRKAQFDKGLIEVTVSNTEPTIDSSPGEDGLSVPEASDTFSDYKAVTGWEGNL